MSHDWVAAVIADLIDYADLNGLPRTAAALREAADLAAMEAETAPPPEPQRRVVGGRGGPGWSKD